MLPDDRSNTENLQNALETDNQDSFESSREPNTNHSSDMSNESHPYENYQSSGLSTLESNIVSLYSSKTPNFAYSFSGIKRKLGNVHQQSLTNSLDRLIEDSWLIKDQYGNYSLDPIRSSFYQNNTTLIGLKDQFWNENWFGRPLQPIPVKKIYQDLHGKWFGKSRYVGGAFNSRENEAVLEWINEANKGQTQLNIRPYEVYARFHDIDWMERDKALEVFNRTLSNQSITIIFEPNRNYNN